MDVDAVLETLEAKGKEHTAKIYVRHGVRDRTFGVSYADLGKLQKKLKRDQKLAERLWRTKVHDARILAAKIADPESMSAAVLQRWIKDVKDHVVSGAVADVASKHGDAEALALSWIDSDKEFVASTGWAMIAILGTGGRLKVTQARKLISRIQREIHDAKNRVRYGMNSALIGIGGGLPALTEAALKAAAKVGKVDVDHGETSCKTPDAASMIGKMVARRR